MRGKARDVVAYWLESFVPWAQEHNVELSTRTVVWDNAPSHSAVHTTQTKRISVFHRAHRFVRLRARAHVALILCLLSVQAV